MSLTCRFGPPLQNRVDRAQVEELEEQRERVERIKEEKQGTTFASTSTGGNGDFEQNTNGGLGASITDGVQEISIIGGGAGGSGVAGGAASPTTKTETIADCPFGGPDGCISGDCAKEEGWDCGLFGKGEKVRVTPTGWWCAADPGWIEKIRQELGKDTAKSWAKEQAELSAETWAEVYKVVPTKPVILTALGEKNQKKTWSPCYTKPELEEIFSWFQNEVKERFPSSGQVLF